MKTNYDTSTTGVNLSLSVFYDGDIAREDFCNDFERINKSDYKFFYTQGGEYSLERFYTVTNREEFIKEFSGDYHTPDSNELEDIDFLLEQYDLGDECAGVSERYPSFEIRGYSQGDYAKIYYAPACLNEHFTEKSLQEYCHHTFYDAPLYCRLDIDDEEFDFNEYLNDSYSYDIDEIIQIAKDNITHEKKEYIVQWLSENLPEYPEYL